MPSLGGLRKGFVSTDEEKGKVWKEMRGRRRGGGVMTREEAGKCERMTGSEGRVEE